MKDLYFKSNDNITNIHGVVWEPNGNIKGIVQIIHGMGEHIRVYDKIAEILNNNGYLVCGIDLLGHGDSVIDKDHLGYFASKNSESIIIEDIHTFKNMISEQYKGFPFIIMGYSLGSIITRRYLEKYSEDLNGALLLSSPYHSKLRLTTAKIETAIISLYHHGWLYRSKFIYNKSTGKYNNYFEVSYPGCWLTKDKEILQTWANDEKRKFRFTCNGYYTLFQLLKMKSKNIKNIKKDLPIFILCGNDDPSTKYGKNILKLKSIYQKNGLTNVKTKTYNNLRHAILFDKESNIVLNDIITFLNLNILKGSNK